MPDKKMNVLDKILCVFKSKKEVCGDIISQADRVVENYIYNKNKLIHRKCKEERKQERIFTAVVFATSVTLAFLVFKIFI